MTNPISPKPSEETKPSAYEVAYTRQLIEEIGTKNSLAQQEIRQLWQHLRQQVQRGFYILYQIRQWLQERRLALSHFTLTTHLSRSEWLAMAMAAGLMINSLGQPLLTQAQIPIGDEFQVNTHTTDFQRNTEIAMDSDGDFIVVWDSEDQDGSQKGIFAQQYNSEGIKQGDEFRINSYTSGRQETPSVGMDQNGNFVVAWTGLGADSSLYSIYAKRYNASGTPQDSEFQINAYTTSGAGDVNIGVAEDGDFVVTWKGNNGIYARPYQADGTAVTSAEFMVNTDTSGLFASPQVAVDSDGDFIITFSRGIFTLVGPSAPFDYEIYARRYNASGTSLGNEFQVNTYVTDDQRFNQVAQDSEGNFIVTWQSYHQDSSYDGIYAQRYDMSGTPVGSEFQVNSYTSQTQFSPNVAMDADGDFVITWSGIGLGDDSSFGIYTKKFNASGTVQGSEFLVNTYTTQTQREPSIGMDTDGNFVIVWNSVDQDGDGYGVFARRYGIPQTNIYLPLIIKP